MDQSAQQLLAGLTTTVGVAGAVVTLIATLISVISRSRARESARFWLETARALPASSDPRTDAEALYLIAVSRLVVAAQPRPSSNVGPLIALWVGFAWVQIVILALTTPLRVASDPADSERYGTVVMLFLVFAVLSLVFLGWGLSGLDRARDTRVRARSRFIGIDEPPHEPRGGARFLKYLGRSLLLVTVLAATGMVGYAAGIGSASGSNSIALATALVLQLLASCFFGVARFANSRDQEAAFLAAALKMDRKIHVTDK